MDEKTLRAVEEYQETVAKHEAMLTKLYTEIGRSYAESYPAVNSRALEAYMKEVTLYKAEKAAYEAEIAKLMQQEAEIPENVSDEEVSQEAFEETESAEISEETIETTEPEPLRCPSCGTECEEGDRFCWKCGTDVSALTAPKQQPEAAAPVCPGCNHPIVPGDKFCTVCGTRLC